MIPTELLDQAHFQFRSHSDHQIRFVACFEHRVREGALLRALQAAIAASPILSYRYVERGRRALWLQQALPDCGEYFSVDEVTAATFEQCLVEERLERTSPLRAPALRCRVLRGAEADALCITIDHTLSDAGGFKAFLSDVFRAYTEVLAGELPGLARAAVANRGLEPTTRVLAWRERLALLSPAARRLPAKHWTFSWQPSQEGEPLCSRFTLMSLDERAYLGLKRFAANAQATLNDVLLTSFLRALRHVLRPALDAVPLVDVPVDLRRHLEPGVRLSLCNAASPIRCMLQREIGRSFEDTLALVKARMDDQKRRRAEFALVYPLMLFRRFISYPAIKRALTERGRPHVPLFSNLGSLDSDAFQGAGVRDAALFGSVSLGGPLSVAVSTYAHRLRFSAGARASEPDHAHISALLSHMQRELQRCAELASD